MSIEPGDVLCTRNNKGWAARLIRLGAALRDKPNLVNHVIIVHHVDDAGTIWGIDGKPGGVGWVDVKHHLKSPYTLSNADQPKNPMQREAIVQVAESLLGTPYDWAGIAIDAMEAIGADRLWHQRWDDKVPAHVVCSSAADWVYHAVGLYAPDADRDCTPADWAQFILEKRWERAPTPGVA